MKLIECFVTYCVRRRHISEEQAPWLRYGLEKRLSTALIAIPFLLLGLLFSPWNVSISLFLSFCYLRGYTNGFHAKTVWGCAIGSLIVEAFFLGVFCRFLPNYLIYTLCVLSIAAIWKLAPFNHPQMGLTKDEIAACAKMAKKRSLILLFAMIAAIVLKNEDIARGIALGVAMTATLLIFAYINNPGGLTYEGNTESHVQNDRDQGRSTRDGR